VLSRVREEQTIIESCPTSNVRLAKLKGLGSHPVWEWTKSGIKVVIGSDDPLIFGSTITEEFDDLVALAKRNGLGVAHVEQIADATVGCCSGALRKRSKDFEKTVAALS
jgi:adenosine deaminase